jgi:carboxyl-terminal processing protease
MKRFRIIFIISLVVIIFSGIGYYKIFNSAKAENVNEDFYQDLLKLFSEAVNMINQYYVDIDKVKPKELAIEGMIKALKDPHSHFLTPKEYKEMRIKTKGAFGGLGIVIGIRNDKLTVISPIEDTPAYKAGIKPGDVITHINGSPTAGLTLQEAVERLRGPKGTKVTVTISRENMEPFDITIIRDIIEINPVKFAKINQEIGYLRITEFSDKTLPFLKKALAYFEKEKIKDIILDLRNNSGGLLEASVDCASQFLPQGALVVKVKGKRFHPSEYRATSKKCYMFGLVVLVNGGTASGAEIVAGALQDHPQYERFKISEEEYKYFIKEKEKNHEEIFIVKEDNEYVVYKSIKNSDRGYLIGEKTFGKSSVQTVMNLSDGSAVSLTTAMYYTPKDRLIHNVGITPDKIVKAKKLDKEVQQELLRLEESNLVKEFVRKFKDNLTQEDLNNFVQTLYNLGYKIEKKLIRKKIKEEIKILKGEALPIYDLENDNQLQEAFFYLLKKSIKTS